MTDISSDGHICKYCSKQWGNWGMRLLQTPGYLRVLRDEEEETLYCAIVNTKRLEKWNNFRFDKARSLPAKLTQRGKHANSSSSKANQSRP